ncbi:MAG: DNA-directed RNA polymerase subunit beta' [bacterium]|nr:DNA-directed RNA polymerase subunit beta' [bacterium]
MDNHEKEIKFNSIVLKLASPDKILSWSRGEVTKPETINYRTQRPERNGLFCERIFGPDKDYECYCGKYRRIRYKGVICEKCGVEVTRSVVRRERMGHIALAVPVSHIWFLRGIPSKMGLLLGLQVSELERVIYFSGYIITKINEQAKAEALKNLNLEYKTKLKNAASEQEKEDLKESYNEAKTELDSLRLHKVLSQSDYYSRSMKYGEVFEAGIGSESVHEIFKNLNMESLKKTLEKEIESSKSEAQKKLFARLNLVNSMLRSGIRPDWMFLTVIPVIPPALRPMVALEGGRHATSDLNDLYRRVINRNNRLKRLIEINSPEVIQRNEKRILQEAVDALLDNSIRRGQNVALSQAQRRPLKSLADMLKGKQGRFRQNLLGKRVDYSGRSVIVVGPELKMHQCGLPKHMALELFRPFVIAKLLKREIAYNVRGAGHLVDEKTPEVWGILEEVIKDKYVLLNRAPTLHRLGIQAFQPVLIEGNAIQVHPLVCSAFNADFDGDQMAVHVPLGDEAQKEANDIMRSSRNLLRPGTGDPIVNPSQDIVLGCYWMTKVKDGANGEEKIFSSPNEAIIAYEFGQVDFRAKIKVLATDTEKYAAFEKKLFETTVGRLLFNSVLPSDFPFINEELSSGKLASIVFRLIEKYGVEITPDILDKIKKFGFEYSTKSGISLGEGDILIPKEKPEMIKEADKKAQEVRAQYEEGLLTDGERYNKVIEIWQNAENKIKDLVPGTLEKEGSVSMMVTSKARGSWIQIAQMAALKGLVVNPAGRIIEFPVLSSYKEGLSVLEYFITTHGTRKGTADTALKTAKAGYLTRRLVDVAQDVVIREDDCGEKKGILVSGKDAEGREKKFASRIGGRVLAADAGEFKKGHLLSVDEAKKIEADGVEEVSVYSPTSCKSFRGVCKKCYGYDLGTNKPVKLGEAVGIVAAQAIGEPGTQLTMRTFHTGGVAAGSDITMGLPRIEEVFELTTPRNPAVLSDVSGAVMEIKDENNEKSVVVLIDKEGSKAKKETKEFKIPFGRYVIVASGEKVKKGDPITDGSFDIKKLFEIAGREATRNYILNEIDKVYTLQGAPINSKHIETIIRQMFSRVKILDSGSTKFNKGEITANFEVEKANEMARMDGRDEAKVKPLVMGIKEVALTSPSFLSAASFQNTVKVLVKTAIEGGEDRLLGLKENVLIGRLIPAGTGFRKEYIKKESEEISDTTHEDEE